MYCIKFPKYEQKLNSNGKESCALKSYNIEEVCTDHYMLRNVKDLLCELSHDETNQNHMHPAKTEISWDYLAHMRPDRVLNPQREMIK